MPTRVTDKDVISVNIQSKMTPDQNKIFRTIDDILYSDWDPIGVNNLAPRNEYQNYTAAIFSLFSDGSDKETIAKKFYEIETVTIGVIGNIERCRQVADKIVKLRQNYC